MFAKGDKVEVMDQMGMRLSVHTIAAAGKKSVKTDCGRKWNHDGEWLDERGIAYPFPFIRALEANN